MSGCCRKECGMRRGKVTGTAARKSIAPYVNSKAPGGQSFPGLFCEMALEEEKEYRLIRLVNRMAAEGHKCIGISAQIFMPAGAAEGDLRRSMAGLRDCCSTYGIPLLSAEAQVTTGVREIVLCLFAAGGETGKMNRKPPCPGDSLVQIGYMALEGTVRLLEKNREKLERRFCPEFLESTRLFREQLPLVKAAKRAWEAGAKAVYSVDEGGIFQGIWEAGESWHAGFDIDLKAVLVRQETIEICELLEINPYRLAGTGCLLACAGDGEALAQTLRKEGVPAAALGRLEKGCARKLHNREEVRFLEQPQEDELYREEEK